MKRIRTLHQRKGRELEGAYLVQGRKLVQELTEAQVPVRSIHLTAEAAEDLRPDPHVTRIATTEQLARMGTLEAGNEVIAVVTMPNGTSWGPLEKDELVLALDGIADPGNLGTIVRLADWSGVHRVLCRTGSVDVFNPKCVQAAMGSVQRVDVRYDDLVERIAEWQAAGARTYLADMNGRSVHSVDLVLPAVLVLGQESHGLSTEVRGLIAETIALPRRGRAESLNVAMAAAALCSEFVRQCAPGS